jgi:hypothetical protein
MWPSWEIHRSEQEFVASRKKEILIIGSRFEPFPEGSCFLALSWYKVILNMKFLKDKAS